MPRYLLLVRNAFSACVSSMQVFHIIKKSTDGFKQSYNAKAGVDADSLLIVTNSVIQHHNDKQQLVTVSTVGFLLAQ